MEEKIPISCLSNLDNENKKLLDSISCKICGGIFFEPIFLKIDKIIVCRKCFFNKHKINQNILSKEKSDILFEKIDIKNIDNLFKFKYFCPLCKSNNSNNKIYDYNALINHLNYCDNQLLFKDLCLCTNIIKIYLKDIKLQRNDFKLLEENKILEKELEKEKSTLNNKEFKNYLESREKERQKSFKNNQKSNIKTKSFRKNKFNKKFLGKKRKDN